MIATDLRLRRPSESAEDGRILAADQGMGGREGELNVVPTLTPVMRPGADTVVRTATDSSTPHNTYLRDLEGLGTGGLPPRGDLGRLR